MTEYISKIKDCSLFFGIKQENLPAMLTCLGSYVRSYQKGELILLSSEIMECVGVILQGTVHMIHEDIWGNKTVLAFLKPGEVFGETFACGSKKNSSVTFYASTNCLVCYLPFYKILHACNMSCVYHHRLIENMVRLIADKNAQLMVKIEVTSKKTLREKILTYLSLQAQLQQNTYFEIPLGRLEFAEYICADRSSLTRELNNMKLEGIIDFDKNVFHLLKEHSGSSSKKS